MQRKHGIIEEIITHVKGFMVVSEPKFALPMIKQRNVRLLRQYFALVRFASFFFFLIKQNGADSTTDQHSADSIKLNKVKMAKFGGTVF